MTELTPPERFPNVWRRLVPFGHMRWHAAPSWVRRLLRVPQSALTRKIVTFNLIALNVLVGCILYLNAAQDDLITERANALVIEAQLIADVFEARLGHIDQLTQTSAAASSIPDTLAGLELRNGVDLHVFDASLRRIGVRRRSLRPPTASAVNEPRPFVRQVTEALSRQFVGSVSEDLRSERHLDQIVVDLAARSMAAGTLVDSQNAPDRSTIVTVASPIVNGTEVLGVIALVSANGEIDALVRGERRRVLQVFMVATLVSVGLSLVLATTISRPISILAEAAELGRKGTNTRIGRVRIPNFTGRSDEIGRLSGAMRSMVATLNDRNDANEQFAADVTHEIKNPLASLRSAVGTLRNAKSEPQREKLLCVIEHDVRRLDRLVSDISDASRLDSELVKEEQTGFNLLNMLENLTQFLGEDARAKGIEFITDLPQETVPVHGLEPRLAQVFVNLISNAISFCESGDAIRVWARRRDARVIVVVEDTGPGIPEDALEKVFERFYSHRPETDFGNNSGLGLAISKQIIDAHGGVIWAENIRPTQADLTSEPLGARFIVGLPV